MCTANLRPTLKLFMYIFIYVDSNSSEYDSLSIDFKCALLMA
jgi:hypothetical protein